MNTTKRTQTVTDRVAGAFAASGHKSNDAIADLLGTTQEDVSHMLSGQYDFTIERLVAIGDALNVDFVTFINPTVAGEAAEFDHRKPDTIRKGMLAGILPSARPSKGARHLVRETDLKKGTGCTP